MKDHEFQPQTSMIGHLRRRDFLKLAGALGISLSALETLLATNTVEAAANDVTSGLIGYWKLDEGSGNAVSDASGNNHGGNLQNGPTWTTGKAGTALSLNGSNTYVGINSNVINTSGSYSVAAWVQISNLNNWATAVSQDGSSISGFFLQYTSPSAGADSSKFAFSLVNQDSTSGTTVRATSPFSPVVNTWYHLVGVHDAGSNQSKLYVNGSLVSTVSVPAAWNAGGNLAIGHAKWGGQVDFWPGLIDDVRAYNRVLSDQEVQTIYSAVPTITPVRPPAVPLIVRSPYVSTWQTSDSAPGTWSTFWNGNVKAITGIVRVDGTAYVFFGAPGGIGTTSNATQTQLEITSTQSRYTFKAGGITLYVTFLSPVEANDIQRLSIPFGLIFIQAHSNDGNAHSTSVYMDISGEWAHGTSSTLINWNEEQVSHNGGNLTAFSITPSSPTVLAETNDYPSWGSAIWATSSASNLTYQSGPDTTVRSLAVSQGSLNNTMDTNQPRAINNQWPVMGLNFNLGSVSGTPTAPMTFVLGHARTPGVSYVGSNLSSLWQSYWSNWQQMLSFAYDDAQAALSRANALDASIASAAVAANGAHYAALCALALRQAFGGVELVGNTSRPWLFLKEISSDGNVSTVDVIYPGMPAFLYTNPYLLSLLLNPIFDNTESGNWPKVFCIHDIGSSYPNATGHSDGNEEDMPIEESANMLIMACAYINAANATDASNYANAHYRILKQWADYLVQNTLDPANQNQTDDFTGFIAHSSNLALKGMLGIGAMGIIAGKVGNSSDQQYYASTASNYISQWVTKSQDSSGLHLKLAYDQDGTWSLKYNAFPDKLLGLNLIPSNIITEEDTWYSRQENAYGIPLDNRHTYTKADWEMWTAASASNLQLRQFFVDALYNFANTTSSRVPFTDWYDTIADTQNGFQARPVIGGLFSILARIKSGH